jgi:phosphate/sulfate permease
MDPQTTSGSQEQPEEDRQNRRQFFNGLGKWSLAIIAAVAALRDGAHDLQSAIGSRFAIGSGGAGDTRQQIARKKGPHGDQPHIDEKHFNQHVPHDDYYRLEKQPGGTAPSGPSGSTDKSQ